MSAYTVVEARDQLPRLVEAALAGEIVTITRDGHPLITLTPASPPEPEHLRITREYLREDYE